MPPKQSHPNPVSIALRVPLKSKYCLEVKEEPAQRESTTLTSYFFSSYDIIQPSSEKKEGEDAKPVPVEWSVHASVLSNISKESRLLQDPGCRR